MTTDIERTLEGERTAALVRADLSALWRLVRRVVGELGGVREGERTAALVRADLSALWRLVRRVVGELGGVREGERTAALVSWTKGVPAARSPR